MFFCLLSCTKQNSYIKREKMMQIVQDVAEAEVFVNTYLVKDSTKNVKAELQKYCDTIFTLHNTNKIKFEESLQHYMSKPDEFRIMLDSIQIRARRTKNLENKIQAL